MHLEFVLLKKEDYYENIRQFIIAEFWHIRHEFKTLLKYC